ncbi:glycosyl transferase [Ciceribacter naphthalenivorans]|uniref:Glycosyl transferase n=3 Tax=Pseudomonadota TaxID=1224 RepID=A0A512HI01_9HYPH|nr:glycosyl transferase [Ciceribacter naphthalenivorans]GLR24593.1 glycosyl transferase [Ciceribacter naphthalenivorans]GLT07449.1 glycosyl transferase [Sphingomonas psychrolutea]
MMECRDQEPELAQTLAVLVAGAVEGLVSDVVVLDHGSSDGVLRIADAAGCRYYAQWDIKDVLRAARGEWLLLVEAGARPLNGWIDEIGEYVALHKVSARFSVSRAHRRPFYKRIGHRSPPLETGLLLQKREALALARSGMQLSQLALGLKPRRLSSEIVPSWVARQGRR